MYPAGGGENRPAAILGRQRHYMTTQHKPRYSSNGRSGMRFVPFLLGFLFAFVVLAAGTWAYLNYGHPPVAVADAPFPMEAQIAHIPLNARIAIQIEKPPFGTSEDVFERGAKLYTADCAFCHGIPGLDSEAGKAMYPIAPQLWKKHGNSLVVGVSDDDPGVTYWKIKNGVRLTGMPAFKDLESDSEMWDVTLLLKNADQPLPDPVMKLLRQEPATPGSRPESER